MLNCFSLVTKLIILVVSKGFSAFSITYIISTFMSTFLLRSLGSFIDTYLGTFIIIPFATAFFNGFDAASFSITTIFTFLLV